MLALAKKVAQEYKHEKWGNEARGKGGINDIAGDNEGWSYPSSDSEWDAIAYEMGYDWDVWWPTCDQDWTPIIAYADAVKGKGKGGGKKGKGWGKNRGGPKGKDGGKKGADKGAWKGKGKGGDGNGKGCQGNCYGCGKFGHSAANCPDGKGKGFQGNCNGCGTTGTQWPTARTTKTRQATEALHQSKQRAAKSEIPTQIGHTGI